MTSTALSKCRDTHLGLTVDERIADGYYYAKSVRFSNIC